MRNGERVRLDLEQSSSRALRSWGRSSRVGGICLVLASAIACGAADQAPSEDAPSLRALLSIERLEVASGEEPSASATAEFVVLPSETDAHEVLDAAGLRFRLPDQNGCMKIAAEPVRELESPGGVPLPQLELLEAGEVDIRAGDNVTRLALNLFPPSGVASGVIYTTPDRSALPLPPDSDYSISASGSDAIPRIAVQGRSPRVLDEVTVGGVPLENSSAIVAGQPLDLTWAEGEAGDHVYVHLSDARTAIQCSFPDVDGSGSIPGALTHELDSGSEARISLHRIREAMRAEEPRPGALIVETTVRFDFELASVLQVD